MWRRWLMRKAATPLNFRKSGKSFPIQVAPSQLLQFRFLGVAAASAKSPFFYVNNSSHFTSYVFPKSPLCSAARFFSSNPVPENEEHSHSGTPLSEPSDWTADSGSGDSVFDFDEKADIGFDEPFTSEGGNGNLDNLSTNGEDSALENDDESITMEGGNNVATPDDGEKLENLLSLLQSRGTVSSLESSLEDLGFAVNEEVILRVLETPLISGENLMVFFKRVLKSEEFRVTTKSLDALVKAVVSEAGTAEAYALWDLVKDVGEKESGVLSTGTLNKLIRLFSKLGKAKSAHEVFTKFGDFGCVPDADTYFWTIHAVSKQSLFDLAVLICEKMLNEDKLPDSEKVGRIISYLCRGNKLKYAHTIYIWAKDRKRFPPQSTVNYLIRLLCHVEYNTRKGKSKTINHVEDTLLPEEAKENVYLAQEMLNDLSGEERKHSIKSFSFVTKGLCIIGDVAGAKNLLLKMVEMGPPPGYTVFNTVISALSRSGDLEDAIKTLKMMEDRGLKPDIYTYSVILAGYVEVGAMEDACKVLDEAKMKHTKLSPCIYQSLIHGYSKLEKFDIALNFMREMKDWGVQPTANQYDKLIKSLCLTALDWRTAENLLEEMKEDGLLVYGKTKSLVQAVKELEEEGVPS